MKITMSGKGFEVTDSLKSRIEKKLSGLDKYLKEGTAANVRISQEKGGRNIVEITIPISGMLLRAEETDKDMYPAIDGAVDKIERQIRRHRTKLEKRLRDNAFVPAPELESEEVPARYEVVRTKRFDVKAMPVDDAIAQMELLDHSFFLFRNEEGELCVLYRRNDGGYGVLQPE